MAEPVIIKQGGGVGETLLILALLAAVAWFIFKNKPRELGATGVSLLPEGEAPPQKPRPIAGGRTSFRGCPSGQISIPSKSGGEYCVPTQGPMLPGSGYTGPSTGGPGDLMISTAMPQSADRPAPPGSLAGDFVMPVSLSDRFKPPPIQAPPGAVASPPPVSSPIALKPGLTLMSLSGGTTTTSTQTKPPPVPAPAPVQTFQKTLPPPTWAPPPPIIGAPVVKSPTLSTFTLTKPAPLATFTTLSAGSFRR